MTATEKRLEAEVQQLLAKAEATDEAEDEKSGRGVKGDEIPAELARRTRRLAKIREAKAALEQQAKEKAEVDAEAQIIVATALTQQTSDIQRFVPMLVQVEKNLGAKPEKASADAGYCSEANVTDARLDGIALFVAPSRIKHHEQPQPAAGPAPEHATAAEQMRHLLSTPEGRDVYKMRKAAGADETSCGSPRRRAYSA